jgi:hypothetical protein
MTTDEMAVYIGERLFDLERQPYSEFYNADCLHISFQIDEWHDYIKSPNANNAIKQAMIKRGFGWEGGYDHEEYDYAFYKEDHYNDRIYICEPTESSALLTSVYVALKAEEDKANAID